VTPLSTKYFNSRLAWKIGFIPAFISILFPLLGFLARCASRFLSLNLPKPRISMLFPAISAREIAANNSSTTIPLSTWVKPVRFDISVTIFFFVTDIGYFSGRSLFDIRLKILTFFLLLKGADLHLVFCLGTTANFHVEAAIGFSHK